MKRLLLAAAISVLAADSGAAQIPDRFENLQVLPKETSRAELIATMRSFASALGVRCVHCHVGEDTPNLAGVDFKSDDRPAKRTARAMMRMVGGINQQLAALPDRASTPIAATCITCHRGFVRPMALDDSLYRVITTRGVSAALADYDSLRSRYYGRAAFDFGFPSLNGLAERLLNERRHTDAVAILQKNLALFPDRWETYFELGRNYEALERRTDAIEAYRAVIMRVPNHTGAAARLRALLGG